MHAHRRVLTVAGLALTVGSLTLSSCSNNISDAGPTDTDTTSSEASASSSTESTTPTPTSVDVPVPAGLVGIGCAGYALKVPSGPGSLDGMSPDPAAAAIANSPQLTTLSSALSGNLNSEVNMVDTLNTGQFTVFAPVDDAWGRLSPETLEKLRADSKLLTSILNYQVVSGQLGPDQVVGEHKTVQGGVLKVTGSGEDFRANDATVICGGIRTSNAVLYLTDTVLMPPPPAPPGASGAPGAPGSPGASTSSTATTSSTDTMDGMGSMSSTATTSSPTSSTESVMTGSAQMTTSTTPSQ